MKRSTGNSYRRRLCKVIDYIYDNLEKDLDVNKLADIAAMSPYHFHRIYRKVADENINATVRRLRLQKAASELIRTDNSILTIAQSVSYTSLEAFSRAFHKQYEETPSQYRARYKQPSVIEDSFQAKIPHIAQERRNMFDVEFIDIEKQGLIGYEHRGDYMEIGQAFEKLFMFAGTHNLVTDETRSFGIYYNDPGSVDKSELRSHACLTVEAPIKANIEDQPEYLEIPSGKCVTIVFKGPYSELEKPYDWLFGEWLPQSGMEAANFPPFEEYLNDPKNTPPSELLTRIYCLIS
ncbi:AraC family transcriptional regulator [Neptuniibacter sp. QD48_11]|uniref:AraC family transcriptional regulator n=1 Tax=unclassified Neptuniibacter TaxID=2630693 RepID=UPI0039F5A51C